MKCEWVVWVYDELFDFFSFSRCGRVEERISGEAHMLLACIMLVQKPEATNFLSHCLLLVVSKHYSIILNYYFNCCTNTTNEKHIQQIHYGPVMLEDVFISSVFFHCTQFPHNCFGSAPETWSHPLHKLPTFKGMGDYHMLSPLFLLF